MTHSNHGSNTSGNWHGTVPFVGLTLATHGSGELILELIYSTLRTMRRWREAWYRRWAIAQTVRELNALSAHTLYDIGVERDDIPAVARRSAATF